jgi:hypothetical protein
MEPPWYSAAGPGSIPGAVSLSSIPSVAPAACRFEWHSVVFYNKLAEIAGEYLKKWQHKEGVEKYTTEMVATEMQMLGSHEAMGEAIAASCFYSLVQQPP